MFRLNMEFMNTSQVSPIENVVISLETGEGLSINSSSNTFYVPKMGPGEKKAQQVDVQALFQTKDSKVQSPKITMSTLIKQRENSLLPQKPLQCRFTSQTGSR